MAHREYVGAFPFPSGTAQRRRRVLRALQALGLRRAGLTYTNIGIRMGHVVEATQPITKERARQLVALGRRLEQRRTRGWTRPSREGRR